MFVLSLPTLLTVLTNAEPNLRPPPQTPIDLHRLDQWYTLMHQRINAAGQTIQTLAKSGQRGVTKRKQDGTTDNAPVTHADVASDNVLRGNDATTKDIFPTVDEERSETVVSNSKDPTWTWIDPLDATREYAEGLDEFVSVMSCVTHYGAPVAGIVHFPFRHETWGARIVNNEGEWELIDAPKGWKTELLPELLSKVVVSRTKHHQRTKGGTSGGTSGTSTRGTSGGTSGTSGTTTSGTSTTSDGTSDGTSGIAAHLSNSVKQVFAGGAGYKIVEVLSSRVAAYAHLTKIKGWDVCAGDAILRAVQGQMVDLQGHPLVYTPEDPVLSGGIFAVLHTDVVDRRRFLSSDKDDEEQATSKNRKKKRKKVQLGPLLGMIAFVAFLRAVLPTYWYTKSTDDATSKNTSVELTEKKNTKDIQQRQRQQPPNKDSKGELQQENTWNHLIFCIVGIQVCYLAWGTAQERLMAHSYGSTVSGAGGEHFHHSTVLLLFNKVLSASLAILLLTRTASSSSSTPSFSLRTILFQTAPPLLYSYAALGNGISSWCQYEALKHTIFPVVVVFKSSKMIPVMLIGSLKFFGKTYPLRDYVVAAIIAVGVTVALVSGGKGGGSGGSVNAKGLVLMFGYITADSFTSNWQSYIFKTYKSTSLHMMFAANSFSSLILAFTVIANGQLTPAMGFANRHPEFLIHAGILGLTSATGQWFIFTTIRVHGPLIFATIMVVRQCLNVILSTIIFGHVYNIWMLTGFCIVFAALGLKVGLKYQARKK